MSKIYVIRKLAYQYDDTFFQLDRTAEITGLYHDKKEALRAYEKLEIASMRRQDLSQLGSFKIVPRNMAESTDIKTMSRYDRRYRKQYDRDYANRLRKLSEYLNSVVRTPLYKKDAYGFYQAQPHTYLPDNFPDKRVLKVLEILGIQFHELNVFEDEAPVFYTIWIPYLEKYVTTELRENRTYQHIRLFLNTYDEALWELEEHAWYLEELELEYDLENLSDQPALLESFLQGCTSFIIEEEVIFSVSIDAKKEDLVGINAFLKEPLFEIRTISLEEAIQIKPEPYEHSL